MDPWQSFESKQLSNDDLKVESYPPEDSVGFEDNFEPEIGDRLPDSEEYLAILEEKLHKIKSSPNILRHLAEKREDCMRELMKSEDFTDETLTLDIPVENSAILRTLLPQRQALTQGELVELVKYDQLIDENISDSSEEPHSR